MLEIKLDEIEMFDESTSKFVRKPAGIIRLEHSLYSLSKWESKWEIPFLGNQAKTNDQVLDYIRCMDLSDPLDITPESPYHRLDEVDLKKISNYIEAKMTATWFPQTNQSPSREIITAELIYYWMLSAGIPLECEHWHLARLLTLIRTFGAKNQPQKKMTPAELQERNRRLNKERREKYKTTG